MDPELSKLVSATWGTLAVAAGVGVVVLATQQVVQDLLNLRRAFQQREIPKIVRRIAAEFGPRVVIHDSGAGDQYSFAGVATAGAADTPAAGGVRVRWVDPARAIRNLIRLAMAGEEAAFYGLPIDQLAGQIGVAAQTVLDAPRANPDLFLVLSAGTDTADLVTLLAQAPTDLPARAANAPPSPEEVAFVDARNRAAHQVQRNLDALQIHMRYWLQFYLQLWAIGVGLALTFLLFWVNVPDLTQGGLIRQGLISGVLAGFFSTLFGSLLEARLARAGGR
ncbi:MAG TPA: hypothetical protein VH092_07040 [Urbifossiella sp.]|nr:hypothetical protein [Urbifossiella sp.]